MLLADLGSLAYPVAKVVEASPADRASASDLHRLDSGGIHGEDTLDADAPRHPPDRKGAAASLAAPNLEHRALEDLGTLALSLPHTVVDTYGVPRPHIGQRSLPRLFSLEFCDDVH
jgi:hypothetical protein